MKENWKAGETYCLEGSVIKLKAVKILILLSNHLTQATRHLNRERNWTWKETSFHCIVLHWAMSQQVSAEAPTSAQASLWPVFHVQQEKGIPTWISDTLAEEIESCSLTWRRCEWELKDAHHAASTCCMTPLFALCLLTSSSSTISRQYAVYLSGAERQLSEFPQEFVITTAHRHTLLTKKTLGAFLEVSFERCPFLTTEPHISPHLPSTGEVQLLLLIHESCRRKFSGDFSFNPQGLLFPYCFHLLHGLKAKNPMWNLDAHPTRSGAKYHCLTIRLRWVVVSRPSRPDRQWKPCWKQVNVKQFWTSSFLDFLFPLWHTNVPTTLFSFFSLLPH